MNLSNRTNDMGHLNAANETNPQVLQECPNCPTARMNGAKYCPVCGHALAQAAPYPVPASPSPISNSAAAEEMVEFHPQNVPVSAVPPVVTLPAWDAKEESQSVSSPTLYCSNCKEPLAPNHRFCFRCGTPAGQEAPACQLTVSGKNGRQTVAMVKKELLIGKLPECDLVIADDDYISRRHARLFREDRMLYLEDMGSANGTYLRVRHPIILQAGDEILVGTTVLHLEDPNHTL